MELKYDHWKEIPRTFSKWPWRFVVPKEVACKGTGKFKVDSRLLDGFDSLRSRYNKPLLILSCFRSPYHNAKVGGAVQSRHLVGDACDISIVNEDRLLLERIALELGFTGLGYYRTFLHIDLRPKKARWGREKWNV